MTVAAPRTRVSSRSGRDGPLAPLRVPAFRVLWVAGFVSNIGIWMQTVGAQWQLVADDSSPVVVALVQTASAAPVLLLALPSGVLGEFLNRRTVMLVTQVVQLGASLALVAMSAGDDLPASTLLTLTCVLGVASAVQMPAAQSVISDIVPREQVADAASLSSISVNVARAAGPAVAGLAIAQFGITAVFIVNAASFVIYLGALIAWRNYRAPQTPAEPFLHAMREGVRFVFRSSLVRSLCIRLAIFLVPANALWALLPVFAKRTLGLGADGYGLLLGVLGVGTIVGAVLAGPWRARWGTNRVLSASTTLFGLALCALLFIRDLWVIFLALVAAGAAWIGVIATVSAVVQASLPERVRTRGLSIYQLVLYGGTAVGSAVSGALAVAVGTDAVLVGAGAVVLLLTALQAFLPLADQPS
ncbi:MFS transporter [uncultured Microbacterium sp.]|uniref:MFS transporter n=1 Tax=uncultured Microbacterium sp. TaxID=191216 RepID=UPI0028F04578|nr:MFS transporter [uncultured Microbacterium sp.]